MKNKGPLTHINGVQSFNFFNSKISALCPFDFDMQILEESVFMFFTDMVRTTGKANYFSQCIKVAINCRTFQSFVFFAFTYRGFL